MTVLPAGDTPHLILGGARSGKSEYAESLMAMLPPPYLYLATAQPLDSEMVRRIELHRARRGEFWETLECPLQLPQVIENLEAGPKPVLVDCLTLWLSNLLATESPSTIEAAVDDLAALVSRVSYPLFIVSNDVGGGIVPDNPLARRFRDLAGRAHQKLARVCRRVTLVVAGLPLTLKQP